MAVARRVNGVILCRAGLKRIQRMAIALVLGVTTPLSFAGVLEVTAVFKPDPANPMVNKFVNTSPNLGHCLWQPAFCETWGLAMNEAMACGIPIFGSTKCGGSIDLIDDSCGLIFDPIDLNSVVNHLNVLADNPDALANLKAGAIQKIQQFRYDKIVDAVIEGVHRIDRAN